MLALMPPTPSQWAPLSHHRSPSARLLAHQQKKDTPAAQCSPAMLQGQQNICSTLLQLLQGHV